MTDALSRRRILAGAAAALSALLAAVPALAAPVASHPDLALHMAARAAVAIRGCVDVPGAWDDTPPDEAEAEIERLLAVMDDKLDIVIATPATTLSGLRDKALAVQDELNHFGAAAHGPEYEGDRTDWLVASLVRDVLALTTA